MSSVKECLRRTPWRRALVDSGSAVQHGRSYASPAVVAKPASHPWHGSQSWHTGAEAAIPVDTAGYIPQAHLFCRPNKLPGGAQICPRGFNVAGLCTQLLHLRKDRVLGLGRGGNPSISGCTEIHYAFDTVLDGRARDAGAFASLIKSRIWGRTRVPCAYRTHRINSESLQEGQLNITIYATVPLDYCDISPNEGFRAASVHEQFRSLTIDRLHHAITTTPALQARS